MSFTPSAFYTKISMTDSRIRCLVFFPFAAVILSRQKPKELQAVAGRSVGKLFVGLNLIGKIARMKVREFTQNQLTR